MFADFLWVFSYICTDRQVKQQPPPLFSNPCMGQWPLRNSSIEHCKAQSSQVNKGALQQLCDGHVGSTTISVRTHRDGHVSCSSPQLNLHLLCFVITFVAGGRWVNWKRNLLSNTCREVECKWKLFSLLCYTSLIWLINPVARILWSSHLGSVVVCKYSV